MKTNTMTPQQRQQAKQKRRAHRDAKKPPSLQGATGTPDRRVAVNAPIPQGDEAFFQTMYKWADQKAAEEKALVDRLRTLDLSPIPGNEQASLIRELMALGRERVIQDRDNDVPPHERSSFLDPNVRPKARKICERMHEITKNKDPNFFHWLFQCDMLSFPALDRRELSVVLDGIGSWRD